MIVICATCSKAGRPSFQREKEPYGDPRISHGICTEHAQAFREQAAQLRAARERVPTHG